MPTDALPAACFIQLEEQLALVREDNHRVQLEVLSEIIRKYRDQGEPGRPVYTHLLALSEQFADDVRKDEVLFELMNRMCGFGPRSKVLAFQDYDPVSGDWL